ncbi:MAG: hypothetical protein VB115_15165 [Christensenellaceae bacterium]|nr:hypothetical protein [Christensenellaceae bacterium]
MARRNITPFNPWETTRASGIEKRYVRFGNSQMLHSAMSKLSHPAYRVYMNMRLEAGGEQGFIFPRAKYKDWMVPDVFNRAVKELVRAGFIEVHEHNAHRRKPNVYRFTEGWKHTEATAAAGLGHAGSVDDDGRSEKGKAP